MMRKNKRGMGNVWAIVGLVAAIGIIALMLGVYVYVLATFVSTGAIAGNANATAAVNAGTNALLSISGWLGLIVTVAVASIVIALVMSAFAFVRAGRE